MGKYLKLFETHSQYTAFTQTEGFILPNVSYCKDQTDIVHYNPIPPMNIITYQATEKLTETTSFLDGGLHTNAFSGSSGQQLEMTSHTFENGVGTIKFDGDIASIGNEAFSSCSSLESVTIPNSVTSIGSSAFNGCSSLTSIDIPSSVTSIGSSAFDNTPWWNTYSADTSHHYGNIIYINDVAYKAVSTAITSCEFKNRTVSISDTAFSNCSSLTSVTIPDSVTSIGENAFYNCRNLTSVTIGSVVTYIGDEAFCSCPLDAISKAAIEAINPNATRCGGGGK